MVDQHTRREAEQLERVVQAARGETTPQPIIEGDCELCGHWSGDLIEGECKPCLEKYHHESG